MPNLFSMVCIYIICTMVYLYSILMPNLYLVLFCVISPWQHWHDPTCQSDGNDSWYPAMQSLTRGFLIKSWDVSSSSIYKIKVMTYSLIVLHLYPFAIVCFGPLPWPRCSRTPRRSTIASKDDARASSYQWPWTITLAKILLWLVHIMLSARWIHFDIELNEEGQIHTLGVLIHIKKRILFGGGNSVQRVFVAIYHW